jgi:hypothetical protein
MTNHHVTGAFLTSYSKPDSEQGSKQGFEQDSAATFTSDIR